MHRTHVFSDALTSTKRHLQKMSHSLVLLSSGKQNLIQQSLDKTHILETQFLGKPPSSQESLLNKTHISMGAFLRMPPIFGTLHSKEPATSPTLPLWVKCFLHAAFLCNA